MVSESKISDLSYQIISFQIPAAADCEYPHLMMGGRVRVTAGVWETQGNTRLGDLWDLWSCEFELLY